jgi:xylulokinase
MDMSLLGIDIGTTGCKAAVFNESGEPRPHAYAEYAINFSPGGRGELDAHQVWELVQGVIQQAVSDTADDPVAALSLSSLAEAFVPVSREREILGPSILNFDARGREYLASLAQALPADRFYAITGHTLANEFGLTKLMWIRRHQSALYDQTYRFLPWTSFVAFMLGAEPVVDYSLAQRLLCLDIGRRRWSDEVLRIADLDEEKLPRPAPATEVIGTVAKSVAERLGLPPGVQIVAGCHDQCAAAVGCAAVEDGQAACGMGTFLCATPVFTQAPAADAMMRLGLNTEYHAAPGKFVSLIYNQGGALLRWYRDLLGLDERRDAGAEGGSVYDKLLAEMPEEPSPVIVLPHFISTGPPHYASETSGVMAGLKLNTTRGDIAKALLEATFLYIRECIDELPATGITIENFRAAGGGSRSDAWLQMGADILSRPFVRASYSEAGLLGAAVIAGVAAGAFKSFSEGVGAMVRLGEVFEPRTEYVERYDARFEQYRRLWPLMQDYLKELSAAQG